MTKTFRISLFLFLSVVFVLPAQSGGCTFSVTFSTKRNGVLYFELIDENYFSTGSGMQAGDIKPVVPGSDGKYYYTHIFTDLPEGEYIIQCFLDTNGNGEMDTGAFGIPKEPYGNSQNFHPKFSPPGFEDVSFELTPETEEISITLIEK